MYGRELVGRHSQQELYRELVDVTADATHDPSLPVVARVPMRIE